MRVRIALPFLLLLISGFGSMRGQEDSERLRREETEDYFDQWLNRDVVYIISDAERDVFENLTTPEEREQFIEQFWFRRDPDPRTAVNEFKEEHYRRVAYANERFQSGFDGWRTDRGRIYILHGEPAEIEAHPSGGRLERPLNEGGGTTTTYPFERWRYRDIDGVGSNVILEFVDDSLSGEYRLAVNPEEKDALLYVPGAGLTLAEELGLASRGDRPFFNPGNRDTYPLAMPTAADNPFSRYETYTLVQASKPIKYTDLKELVKVNVSYSSLPIEVREDYFSLNQTQALVPVTVQIENSDLSFETDGETAVGHAAVYGIVTSITNRLISEFDHDLVTSFPAHRLSEGVSGQSVYQKVLLLDRRQRYRLDLIVRDNLSDKVGAIRKALIPPTFDDSQLTASSVILSDSIEVLDSAPDESEMFVIGDVKVRPRLNRTFTGQMPMGIYFQLYHAALDQTTLRPALEVSYRLLRDGEVLRQTTDRSGESIQYFSGRRVVVVKRLSAAGLEPGIYRINIQIRDRLSGQSVELNEDFTLIG